VVFLLLALPLPFATSRAEESCLCTRGRRRRAGLGRRGDKKGARSREEKKMGRAEGGAAQRGGGRKNCLNEFEIISPICFGVSNH
jgi:hypothetical protein